MSLLAAAGLFHCFFPLLESLEVLLVHLLAVLLWVLVPRVVWPRVRSRLRLRWILESLLELTVPKAWVRQVCLLAFLLKEWETVKCFTTWCSRVCFSRGEYCRFGCLVRLRSVWGFLWPSWRWVVRVVAGSDSNFDGRIQVLFPWFLLCYYVDIAAAVFGIGCACRAGFSH